MKNQYFGDRRDVFKYELILDVVRSHGGNRLTLVPMLTPDDGSGEGNVPPVATRAYRGELLDFFAERRASNQREIGHLRDLMARLAITFMPYRDAAHFVHEARADYFQSIPHEYLSNAVIFVDPDTGLEARTHSYMREKGLEKYLMYHELLELWTRASHDSVLVVYQHLQRNARLHMADVQRRLDAVSAMCGTQAFAVRWHDLAFVVVAKNDLAAVRVRSSLVEHARRHLLDFAESINPNRVCG